MGKRTKRERLLATLGNWRWWLAVALFSPFWLAVAALYWILWAVELAAQQSMDELERAWNWAIKPLRRWVFGAAP